MRRKRQPASQTSQPRVHTAAPAGRGGGGGSPRATMCGRVGPPRGNVEAEALREGGRCFAGRDRGGGTLRTLAPHLYPTTEGTRARQGRLARGHAAARVPRRGEGGREGGREGGGGGGGLDFMIGPWVWLDVGGMVGSPNHEAGRHDQTRAAPPHPAPLRLAPRRPAPPCPVPHNGAVGRGTVAALCGSPKIQASHAQWRVQVARVGWEWPEWRMGVARGSGWTLCLLTGPNLPGLVRGECVGDKSSNCAQSGDTTPAM